MTPLAHLLVAAAALAACASAAPTASTDLADIELEDPSDKITAPVLIANDDKVQKDVRAKPVDIPVEIIEDSRPAIKTNEVTDDEEEIKRPSIDLRNPGPPQRQEHDTQNSDHFPASSEKLATVRETIQQTQNLLRQGIQGVSNDILNWLSTNDQVNTIQQNIQSLRDTFTNQIQKLNEGIAVLQPLKTEIIPESVEAQPDIKKVKTDIEILENNFDKGVRALSEGVSIVAILRAEDESAAAAQPTPAPAQPVAPVTISPPLPFLQFISNLQASVSSSMNNITQALNLWNPTTTTLAPSVLADSPDGTTPRPADSPWPNWQLPNIQSVQTTFQNAQIALQNNPIVQGITNLLNPSRPNDDKKPDPPAAAVVPAPAAAPPAVANDVVAPVTIAAPVGPIRQILSNSPVVQSIAGTVQRIQSSINNPEQPRDSEKNEDLASKGGFYGGNRPNASGGTNDSSSGLKQEIASENKEQDAETKKPEVVLEKTE